MANPKSPFIIIRQFLSPKQCQNIIGRVGFYEVDKDTEGNPIKMVRGDNESEEIIFDRLVNLIPHLEEYYGYSHKGTERISFEMYPTGVETDPLCENANWVRKKWLRTKDRDISAILFLSDYNKDAEFDSDYEVYGGKLGFHNFNFSFHPEMGTLVIYPSGPHFINSTSVAQAGDLYQARFHMAGKMPYMYDPKDFPGAEDPINNWFKDFK